MGPKERIRIPSESRTVIASAVVVTRASYVRRVKASVSPDACQQNNKNNGRISREILHDYKQNEHVIAPCADSKCARACNCNINGSTLDGATSAPAKPA